MLERLVTHRATIIRREVGVRHDPDPSRSQRSLRALRVAFNVRAFRDESRSARNPSADESVIGDGAAVFSVPDEL
jgi:hypothetical protein